MNKKLKTPNVFASFTAKQKIIVYSIIGIFTLVFCSISLVNHYLFRTSAYDLGIYNQVLYSYAHFKISHTPIQQPLIFHIFADHFEPIFILFAPLYYLFGSYTLLVIQIALIVAGGIGMLRFAWLISKSFNLSVAILVQFYGMWGVYSALSFDFHNNVTAAMLLPWLLVFIEEKKIKPALIIWILMLFSKENMALFTGFVCLGLGLHYFKQKPLRNLLFGAGVLSFIYFVVVVKLFIPFFLPDDTPYLYESHYKALGNGFGDVLMRFMAEPGYVFSLLFEHPNKELFYAGIKSEFHFAILVCGGVFLFFKPQFLFMLIPIYAQKLFISDATRWGINYHYSIELVPVVSAATLFFIHQNLSSTKLKLFLPWLVVMSTLLHTQSKIKSRTSIWYDALYTNFLLPQHYQTHFDVNKAKQQLKRFNNNESISAQTDLVPWLANRDSIYLYPATSHARYIVLAPGTRAYPYNDSTYYANLDTLYKSAYWKAVETADTLKIFERVTPNIKQ
ncbi:MAG: DUF2079 domain-containing protein [Bacteroidota bacterium]